MVSHILMALGATVTLIGGPPPAGERYLSWVSGPTFHSSQKAGYEARIQPGATARFWIGGAVTRLLHSVTPGSRRAVLGAACFDLLSTIPTVGEYSSEFGYRQHPISKRRKLHRGLDFAAPRGTHVYASGPGQVIHAGRRGSYGNLVIISHGLGLETRYAHLRRVRTESGRFVTAGTVIGTVGSTGRSTGPHLHFEVRQFGEPINPKWALGLRTPTLADELAAVRKWLTAGSH